MSLRLDWCSHAAAKYAVEKWHYSKSMPVGKTVKVGVWEESRFVGCVVFAYGANSNISKPFGLTQTQVCELVRVALTHHESPVSQIVAQSLRMLRQSNPGIELVVSYADTREGHHGGIYQAGNWTYLGSSPGATEYQLNGRWVHSMQIQTFIRAGRQISRSSLPKRQAGAKHKYVMAMNDQQRKRIEPLRKPYPKRVRSVDSDTSANHAEEGGATPTRTL